MKSQEAADVFQAGDAVICSSALAAPILINRTAPRHVCPLCGTVFPHGAQSTCPHCQFPYPLDVA